MPTNPETEVLAKHLCFKPSQTTNAMLDIVEQMLAGKTWGDEFTLSPDAASRNTIGTAYKLLMGAGVVQQTGAHRRSAIKEQKGRVCWEYRLVSTALARTFLSRNGRVVMDKQLELLM